MARSQFRLPSVGALAPDFTLPATDGGVIHFAQFPKPVALIFLRHLG